MQRKQVYGGVRSQDLLRLPVGMLKGTTTEITKGITTKGTITGITTGGTTTGGKT